MHAPSLLLLLGAAAIVAILHSILPDHWVPLAIVARTQRWSLLRVARVSALASIGHVVTSLILAGIIALIGLQFQQELETQQGHIIGGILILTGLGFLLWEVLHRGSGHGHSHSAAGHTHTYEEPSHSHAQTEHEEEEEHDHDHTHNHASTAVSTSDSTVTGRLSAMIVSFGIAASPDLTILPVALAATALGSGAVAGVLGVFTILTLATFIGLTLLATIAGYQIKGVWLEKNANSLTSLVLIAIGIVAFIGL